MVQQARYEVRIQDTGGNTRAILDSFISLDYELRINDFSTLELVIPGDDSRISEFVTDAIIQIWRRPDGLSAYKEAEFFHRSNKPERTPQGLNIFTSRGRGFVDLLHRREILYTGVTAFTQKAGSGEGVMKDYVRENAGEGASEFLRKYNGVTPGLFIQGDLDRGGLWRGERSMRNLLDVLQEVALATRVDFDVVRLQDTGPPTFMFITGYPQIGRDLTQSVVFSAERDNMIGPNYTLSRIEEANIVAILGPGDNTSRIVIVSTSPAMNDSPWNKIEISQDARNQTTIAALFTVGEQEIAKLRAQETFIFEAVQTELTQYGVHYRLGDRVTAAFSNIIAAKKLTRVHITVRDYRETIEMEFSDIVLGSVDPLNRVIRNLNSRIKQLAVQGNLNTGSGGLVF